MVCVVRVHSEGSATGADVNCEVLPFVLHSMVLHVQCYSFSRSVPSPCLNCSG